jgi:hypothetical protein
VKEPIGLIAVVFGLLVVVAQVYELVRALRTRRRSAISTSSGTTDAPAVTESVIFVCVQHQSTAVAYGPIALTQMPPTDQRFVGNVGADSLTISSWPPADGVVA